jgi:hypothetical protein
MNQNLNNKIDSIADLIISKVSLQLETKKPQLNQFIIDELSNPSFHNAITNQFINPLLAELSSTYEKFFVTMLVFVIATFFIVVIILFVIFFSQNKNRGLK